MQEASGLGPDSLAGPPVEWRVRVLNGALVWTVLLGALPTLIAAWRLAPESLAFSAVAICLYSLVLLTAIRRSLSFRTRALLFVSLLFAGGTLALLQDGIRSEGPLLLFGSVLFVAIFFSLRASVAALLLSLATMIGLASGFSRGLIEPIILYSNSAQLAYLWTSRILIWGLLLTGVVFSLGYLIRQLEESLSRSRELVDTLERSRDLLSRSQKVAGIGGWNWDPRTERLTGSENYYNLIGRDPGESLADLEREVLHPEDRERFSQVVTRISKQGNTTDEFRIVRPDGSERIIRLDAEAEFANNGELIRVAGLTRDVTDERKAQERSRTLEAQLLQSQKMEAVGKLAGGIAHDFNNLLTVISGYGELLIDRVRGDEVARDATTQIQAASDRAAELTRKLLAFSRKQVLRPEILDLNEVVRGLELMLGRLIGKQVSVKIDLDPQAGRIEADPGQLEQVIVNLAVNAQDAMPDGGILRISTQRLSASPGSEQNRSDDDPRHLACLSVSDTGMGMDAQTQEKIFDPFFTTKQAGEGTGLGLAMVYGFVRQSGGSIAVDSRREKGTTIRILLPCVETELSSLEPPRPAQTAPSTTRRTILVVEDEPEVRALVRTTLESRGHKIFVAESGDAALDLAQQHGVEFDAVVTDIVMPGITGVQLCTKLRETLPNLRVLFMSGYAEESHHSDQLLSSNSSFLQKPFRTSELLEALHELLENE